MQTTMKNITINIRRTPEQIIEINDNQVEFINSIRGKKEILKRAAADFLRKKRQHEAERRA